MNGEVPKGTVTSADSEKVKRVKIPKYYSQARSSVAPKIPLMNLLFES